MCLFVFFFFFQAEDGIRDGTVTGVQTCALPILRAPPESFSPTMGAYPGGRRVARRVCRDLPPEHPCVGGRAADQRRPRALRSEERRVGKECRSRWSAYH